MRAAQPVAAGERRAAPRARRNARRSVCNREGIDGRVDRLRPAHPGLGPDAAHPVGEARDAPQILDDMLLADQPDGDETFGRDGEDRKSGVSGERGSVRVDLGGRSSTSKKLTTYLQIAVHMKRTIYYCKYK